MTFQIYLHDGLISGWKDYGWANRDYNDTTGGGSIRCTPNAGEGVYMNHAPFDATAYDRIHFWTYAGTGGQVLRLEIIVNGATAVSKTLSALVADTWQEWSFTFAEMGLNTVPNVDGVIIRHESGTTNTFYINDIYFGAKAIPDVVNVVIDRKTIKRTVDAEMFGLNNGAWESSFLSPDTEPLLSDMGIKVLRFPGGSFSDEYHWQTNTSHAGVVQALSFDDFAVKAKAAGQNAFISVNYGSGTAQEAADWVAHSKAQGYGFKWWEIGNECYGTWETDINVPAHDPYTYATRAADYMTRMRAADNTVKIGIVVVPNEVDYKQWMPLMLGRLVELNVRPDFAVYHRYGCEPGKEHDESLLYNSKAFTTEIAQIRSILNKHLGANTVEIVVTEANSAWSLPLGKQTHSLVNGLFLADQFGWLLQTEVKAFVWWQMRSTPATDGNMSPNLYGWRNTGGYGVVSQEYTGAIKYPTFFTYKLLKQFAEPGDKVIECSSDHPILQAFAVLKATGEVSVMFINKHPTQSQTVVLSEGRYASAWKYGVLEDDNQKSGSSDITTMSVNPTLTVSPYTTLVIRGTFQSSGLFLMY